MNNWSASTDRNVLMHSLTDLKHQVERAYYFCRYGETAEAHDDLCSAEWRLRQAERRGRG